MSTARGWRFYAEWLDRQLLLKDKKIHEFGIRIRKLEEQLKAAKHGG